MRIAQIAPLTESVPPRLYGGTERVVSFLTEELVAMGHDVTLFASGDSRTSAELVSAWPCALRFDASIRDANAPHMLMMEQVCRRAAEFDVLHFHMDYWSFSLFGRQPTPFLTTLHGRLDLPELVPVFDCFPHSAAGVDFRCAAAAAAGGELHRNGVSRSAGGSADATARYAALSGVPRPHLSGEATRPRHPHRPAGRYSVKDCGKDRSRR